MAMRDWVAALALATVRMKGEASAFPAQCAALMVDSVQTRMVYVLGADPPNGAIGMKDNAHLFPILIRGTHPRHLKCLESSALVIESG